MASRFTEREERLVARRRHDPALDVLDGGLRLRLVPGLARPRREHGRPVVGGEFLVRGVQIRLVAAWGVSAAGHGATRLGR